MILNLINNNPQERIFIIRGGQGASKTISILQLIIQSLLSSEKEATVLSSELSKMKKTVIRDYKKLCKDWGVMSSEQDFNRSESKHEYPNESYVDFLGADTTDLGKGFRRDILYINEADRMDIETASQFISRAKLTLIDYNPDSRFWGDDYVNDNNLITLTFEDNEYLDKEEEQNILDYKTKGFYNPNLPQDKIFDPANIKSSYWSNRWRVYGCGLIGSLEGVCIPDWKELNKLPDEARLLSYGLDFGYSNDPSSLVALYKYNDAYIFDEVFYQKGLLNSDISDLLKSNEVTRLEMIYADSAEPKSIAELNNYGHTVYPVTKGRDSIVHGLNLINQNKIFVTKRSTNLIKELRNYVWMTDKEGSKINKPIDAFNHAIDAARYALTMQLENAHKGEYHIY